MQELRGNRIADVDSLAQDLPDGCQQVFSRRLLHDVALGSGTEGPFRIEGLVVHREDQHGKLGKLDAELFDQLNAVRHGKPARIVIGLHRSGKHVELTIANNGRNFISSPSRKPGMGLHIMKYRARLIGGEISIAAQRPKGTVVKCIFHPKAKHD